MNENLLLEISLSNLKNNVKRVFGPERETRSKPVNVVNYQAVPSISNKTLLFKFNINSGGTKYSVNVNFINVVFFDKASAESRPDAVSVVATDGTEYFFQRFTSAQKQVKVNCSCLDFHFRFSVWNHQKDALDGDPPQPYVKKTDREPVNPTKSPGACKHILKCVEFLRGEGILR